MMLHDAIYKLNQTVVTIRGDVAYDANEQVVEYDKAQAEALVAANAYKVSRASEYPDFKEYLDGIVKGDQAQVQAYIDACNAIKNKYPKGA
jgi:ribosome-interacting GTPase 1